MRIVLKLYAGLFSCLFAIVFTAQVLGFLGIYQPIIAIPATLITAGLAYWGYQKWQLDLNPSPNNSALIIIASLILVFFVFVLRMLLWPYSELGTVIPVDFFAYHGIKTLELARSGSMWNLAIPYGDYPNGYESLSAFALFFYNNIRVLGFFHALIFLLTWLTLALLLIRFSSMSLNFALFLSALIFFFPFFYSLTVMIGKNDGLLSLTILMAILHAPIPSRQFHPLGLAYATMLSLAVKASGLYILFFLWALVLLFWFMAWREGKGKDFLNPIVFGLCLAMMFVGGLWVVRNYILMKEVLTSEVRSFFITSIGASLGNPILYNSNTETWVLFLGAAVLLITAIIAFKRWGWTLSLLLLVIAITFIFTPLSAFHTIQSQTLHIEWRYVLHGALLVMICLLAFSWQLFGTKLQAIRFIPITALSISVCLLLLLNPLELLSYDARLYEQFYDPSGAAPSVYDEVAQLENGIVYLEGGEWFHLAYANPRISVTQGTRYPLGRGDIYPAPIPDYAVFVPNRYQSKPSFANLDAIYQWELIYSDETGQLYRRVP